MLRSWTGYQYFCVSIWNWIIGSGLEVGCNFQFDMYCKLGAKMLVWLVENSIWIWSLWRHDRKYLIENISVGDNVAVWMSPRSENRAHVRSCSQSHKILNFAHMWHTNVDKRLWIWKMGLNLKIVRAVVGVERYQNRLTNVHENLVA